MSLPTSGTLANTLILVLPSGATLTVTDLSEWAWIEPPPAAPPSATPALELRGLVGAGTWGAMVAGAINARVVLRSPGGERLGEAVVTWLGSNAVGLRLLPGPVDLLAYLRGPSRSRAEPLSADELAALVEATRDDDPAGLIPRLLATVAAERERVGPLGVRIVSPAGEKIQIGQALVLTSDGRLVPAGAPGVHTEATR